VTAGEPRRGFGFSPAAQARLTHVPRVVLFGWRGGRCVGSQVVWVCGGRTRRFEFAPAAAAAPGLRLCRLCSVLAFGRYPR
jgi:hypothetical protein